LLHNFGSELAYYGNDAALGQGALLVSMIWAAALVWIIERRFLHACCVDAGGRAVFVPLG